MESAVRSPRTEPSVIPEAARIGSSASRKAKFSSRRRSFAAPNSAAGNGIFCCRLSADDSRTLAGQLPSQIQSRGTEFLDAETGGQNPPERPLFSAETGNVENRRQDPRRNGLFSIDNRFRGSGRLDGGVRSPMRTGLSQPVPVIPCYLHFFRDKDP